MNLMKFAAALGMVLCLAGQTWAQAPNSNMLSR